jgi:hypothetical protein
MRGFSRLCAWLCAAAFAAMASSAWATSSHTFVASNGSDSNTCVQGSPCLTLAHALTQTTAGGEIDCITGGNFGPVTITGSITIDCGVSQVGTIAQSSSPGVHISTGTAATIILRNLNINGFETSNGVGGIVVNTFAGGGKLIIQNCNIHGFLAAYGLSFTPASGGRALLEVSNTRIYDNAEGVNVNAGTSSTIVSAMFNNVEISANTNDGLDVGGTGVVAGTLRQSLVSENGIDGINATASQVYFTVEESSVIDNLSLGIEANSSGVNLEVGATSIGGNSTGVGVTAGVMYSFDTNQMSTNATNGSFSGITPLE